MIRILPIFLSWILWLILGAYCYHTYCGHDVASNSKINSTEIQKSLVPDAPLFESSSFQLLQPLSVGLSNQISEYLDALNKDEEKRFSITGHYNSNEVNGSILPNLGEARANNMKQFFVQNGIAPSRIEIVGKEIDAGVNGDLKFSFTKAESKTSKEDYQVLFEHNPIVVPFKLDEESIVLNEEIRNDFSDLIKYLDLDQGLKINLEGHTDAKGDREKNIVLSKERANSIKEILIKNGIAPSRMLITAYGPDRPLVSNNTEEGRMKNRRVEISVDK